MPKATLYDSRIKKYAYLNEEEIYSAFGTSSKGLAEEEVDDMREKYGENDFTVYSNDSMLRRIKRAFINPFNIVMFVLCIISLISDVILADDLAKNVTTPIIIFVMILISALIRFILELRAKIASDKLNMLVHESITVKRDNIWVEIPADELVVGDIISISAGDRVPADIRLTKTHDLFVSQASITGESTIIEKHCETLKDMTKKTDNKELENLSFMGTTVIGGRGIGVVLAVGRDTLYGSFTKNSDENKRSFQVGSSSIAWVMLRFMIILLPIMFVLLGITGGQWLESLVFSLSVALGLMPEMLPMVITACLARGSMSMGKKETIIKDINAMQVFGSMDVLCMDKTGTLTNESIILEYYMDILGKENSKILDLAYVNSFFHSGVRNAIDNAILACKTMPGHELHYMNLQSKYKKIDEIPFDYNRKIASILVNSEDNTNLLISKGDIDNILKRCKYIKFNDNILEIGEDAEKSVYNIVDEMLNDGMKVIAVAEKNLSGKDTMSENDESDMILMGYLAFFDAPKSSAKESIESLKKLNVMPKILTGDQCEVAVSICRRVGISSDTILSGEDIDNMTDTELGSVVEDVQVFAELTPAQKVRLVSALRENGHTVGFMGDGINDIPALNEAHVGISVDTAVDAAKDAADVVLLQKDLRVLEKGILEGRKTSTNMLKYIKVTASSNFGNIIAIIIAAIFLPFLPMTSVQILMLNLVYNIICIFMPWDNVEKDQLISPHAWSGKMLSKFMFTFGPVSAIFDFITFAFLYFFLCPLLCGGQTYSNITDAAIQAQYVTIFQTGWFLESIWTQVFVLYTLRSTKIPIIKSRPSTAFTCITLLGIIIVSVLIYTSFAPVLGLTSLPVWYFACMLLVAVVYIILTSVIKMLYQKKYHELI